MIDNVQLQAALAAVIFRLRAADQLILPRRHEKKALVRAAEDALEEGGLHIRFQRDLLLAGERAVRRLREGGEPLPLFQQRGERGGRLLQARECLPVGGKTGVALPARAQERFPAVGELALLLLRLCGVLRLRPAQQLRELAGGGFLPLGFRAACVILRLRLLQRAVVGGDGLPQRVGARLALALAGEGERFAQLLQLGSLRRAAAPGGGQRFPRGGQLLLERLHARFLLRDLRVERFPAGGALLRLVQKGFRRAEGVGQLPQAGAKPRFRALAALRRVRLRFRQRLAQRRDELGGLLLRLAAQRAGRLGGLCGTGGQPLGLLRERFGLCLLLRELGGKAVAPPDARFQRFELLRGAAVLLRGLVRGGCDLIGGLAQAGRRGKGGHALEQLVGALAGRRAALACGLAGLRHGLAGLLRRTGGLLHLALRGGGLRQRRRGGVLRGAAHGAGLARPQILREQPGLGVEEGAVLRAPDVLRRVAHGGRGAVCFLRLRVAAALRLPGGAQPFQGAQLALLFLRARPALQQALAVCLKTLGAGEILAALLHLAAQRVEGAAGFVAPAAERFALRFRPGALFLRLPQGAAGAGELLEAAALAAGRFTLRGGLLARHRRPGEPLRFLPQIVQRAAGLLQPLGLAIRVRLQLRFPGGEGGERPLLFRQLAAARQLRLHGGEGGGIHLALHAPAALFLQRGGRFLQQGLQRGVPLLRLRQRRARLRLLAGARQPCVHRLQRLVAPGEGFPVRLVARCVRPDERAHRVHRFAEGQGAAAHKLGPRGERILRLAEQPGKEAFHLVLLRVAPGSQGGGLLAQPVLQREIRPCAEHFAEDLLAALRAGREQLEKIALGDHRDLREARAVQAGDLRHARRDLLRLCEDGAVRQGKERVRVLHHRAAAAPGRALVFRAAAHRVRPAGAGERELHPGGRLRRGVLRAEHGGIARVAARLAVERVGDGVENGRLAGAGVPADEVQPLGAQIGKRDLRPAGVRPERGDRQMQRPHASPSHTSCTSAAAKARCASLIGCPFCFSYNSPSSSSGVFCSGCAASSACQTARVRLLS